MPKNVVKMLPVRSSVQKFEAETVNYLGSIWAAWKATGAGWATKVGCSACGAHGCEAKAQLGNMLGSRCAWSDMAWAMALVSWALDGTAWACLNGMAQSVVVTP
ncbi:hypothetical protein ACFX11_015021 [Malus domestica]